MHFKISKSSVREKFTRLASENVRKLNSEVQPFISRIRNNQIVTVCEFRYHWLFLEVASERFFYRIQFFKISYNGFSE